MRRIASGLALLAALASPLRANNTPQTLPFSQNWTNIGLITANDDWAGVPGIEGFRGDNLTAATGTDPQTIVDGNDVGPVLDVNANQTNPDTFGTGGVAEFHVTDPAVALTGSGTADAPYLRLYLNTTGAINVTVSYTLRDLDGSVDDAIQPVAIQYRVGSSGDFTNLGGGFVADATSGPSEATLETGVCAVLPVAAENQALVQVRIITANAIGNDEWVAVDDIAVDTAGCGGGGFPELSIDDVSVTEGDAGTVNAVFTVSLSGPAQTGGVTFDIATADGSATTADNDYVGQTLLDQTIAEGDDELTFTVVVNGDLVPEPNQSFFVNVTDIGGATIDDGQGVGTILNDDLVLIPIHDIQGPGASSPIVGSSVTTRGIVTGLKSNGFFLQAPDAQVDADPATSEGIFVFTSAAPPPSAPLGALVQVSGTVVEFVPTADALQPPLTELSSPSVVQISTGNPLPAPIPLTLTFPDPAGPFDQMERLEGMRVSAASLTVVGPTLGNVNEPNATATTNGVFYATVTGHPRPVREPGIQAPDPAPTGSIPPIPRFDTNPESIRIDSDAGGHAAIDAGAGAILGGVVGPFDYGFRKYTITPDAGAVITVAGGPTATAVADPTPAEATVASYNIERFFDTVNDPDIGEPVLTPAAFAARLAKASLGIRNYLKTPDVVGIVECENLSTLQALAAQISADAIADAQPDPEYDAYLVEGNDIGGIDVGFLVKTAFVTGTVARVEVTEVVQELDGTLFVNPDASTETLNDRPTLRLTGVVNFAPGGSLPLTVMVNHLRSLNGVADPGPGANGWPTAGARVRAKRLAQAEDLADLVQARQVADSAENMVLVGDFNAFEFNDGLVHSMGTITGAPVPDNETAVPGDGVDLVTPNLAIEGGGYSFIFDGNAQSLDHAVVGAATVAATSARRVEHPRINADFPAIARNLTTVERLADHDPLVLYLQPSSIPSNLIFRDGFESADVSWWSTGLLRP